MARYIDADQLEEAVVRTSYWDNRDEAVIFDLIETMNAADVAPVRHGRWDSVKNPQWPAYSHDKCSKCGWWNTKDALCYDGVRRNGHSLNYCPNCGAMMDGGAE